MKLNWIKCSSNQWCSLQDVNLRNWHVSGVYIIWHGGNPGRVVYVGESGDIADRLGSHRSTNQDVLQYAHWGLYVTWAEVANYYDRLGLERYFADRYEPLVGVAYPDVVPIPANSPWD